MRLDSVPEGLQNPVLFGIVALTDMPRASAVEVGFLSRTSMSQDSLQPPFVRKQGTNLYE